jgi:hypothetical protein
MQKIPTGATEGTQAPTSEALVGFAAVEPAQQTAHPHCVDLPHRTARCVGAVHGKGLLRDAGPKGPKQCILWANVALTQFTEVRPAPAQHLLSRSDQGYMLPPCVRSLVARVKATLSQATRLQSGCCGCRERCPPWAKATTPTTTHSAAASTRI